MTEKKTEGSAHPSVWATTLNDDTKSPKNPNTAAAEESAKSQHSAALTSVPGSGGPRGRLGN